MQEVCVCMNKTVQPTYICEIKIIYYSHSSRCQIDNQKSFKFYNFPSSYYSFFNLFCFRFITLFIFISAKMQKGAHANKSFRRSDLTFPFRFQLPKNKRQTYKIKVHYLLNGRC